VLVIVHVIMVMHVVMVVHMVVVMHVVMIVHVIMVMLTPRGLDHGSAIRSNSERRFGGAVHVSQRHAAFTSDSGTVFELRREHWLHTCSPGSLAADFAPRC
jgi:hypothetical protein